MAYEVIAKSPDFIITEGPHWDAEKKLLYFVDILGGSVSVLDYYKDKLKTYKIGSQMVSSVLPRKNAESIIITVGLNICSFDLETEKMEVICTVEPGNETRLNDSKCDALGRIWTGTMGMEVKPAVVDPERGSMYSFDGSGVLQRHTGKLSISNGFAWSNDNKTMYYIDSCKRNVVAYDFDLQEGKISNCRVCIDFSKTESEEVLPDGLCIDAEDKLWVALYRGWKVVRCDPKTGEILKEVKLPAAKITSCCFAGDNLDELVITSTKSGLSEEELKEQPLAGSVFKVKDVGTKGLPGVSYAG